MGRRLLLVPALAATALLAACGGGGSGSAESTQAEKAPALPTGSEPAGLDPADFVSTIDNPYWPMPAGARWVYRETDGEGGEQQVEVEVTRETKTILGIEATVVHDVVTEDGEVIEDTLDWYAQDRWGNVWYLGEQTVEYDGGEASTTGSWEAGVDGAEPGVIVPAIPAPGQSYRQEYLEGVAEDQGAVLSVSEWVEVPAGSYEEALLTKDWTPLEPDVLEYKLYAKGVGPVLALGVSGGAGREELVRFEQG